MTSLGSALLSLARFQRRRANEVTRWLAEAEAAGNQRRAERYRRTVARLWREAKFNLRRARDELEGAGR